MIEPTHPLYQLLKEDKRYRAEAYYFIFEALSFAQNELGLGADKPSEELEKAPSPNEDEEEVAERHVTGQELCEAIRQYALHQYGYMAKTVLNSWGITRTDDFGEIVFSLIRIGQMRKTPADNITDFSNIYDFEAAFCRDYRIKLPHD